jgi:hypothetical protein
MKSESAANISGQNQSTVVNTAVRVNAKSAPRLSIASARIGYPAFQYFHNDEVGKGTAKAVPLSRSEPGYIRKFIPDMLNNLMTFEQFMQSPLYDMNKVAIYSQMSWAVRDAMATLLPQVYQVWTSAPTKEQLLVAGNIPILLWSGYDSKNFLNVVDGHDNRIYNFPHGMDVGKEAVYKGAMDAGKPEWMPETHFDYESAVEAIGFPMVAKTDNSYESRGVKILKNKKSIEEHKDLEFSVFQHQIEIKEEWRAICFRGKNSPDIKLLNINKRTPLNDKAKSLRKSNEARTIGGKELSEQPQSNFRWEQKNPESFEFAETLLEIAEFYFSRNYGLNVCGFDVASDGNHLYLIELNSVPAMFSTQALTLYKALYEDFFMRPLSDESNSYLTALARPFTDWAISQFNKGAGEFVPDPSVWPLLGGRSLTGARGSEQ